MANEKIAQFLGFDFSNFDDEEAKNALVDSFKDLVMDSDEDVKEFLNVGFDTLKAFAEENGYTEKAGETPEEKPEEVKEEGMPKPDVAPEIKEEMAKKEMQESIKRSRDAYITEAEYFIA